MWDHTILLPVVASLLVLPSWRPGFSVTFFCGAEIPHLGLLFPCLCFLFSASSLGPSSSCSLSVIRAPLWCLHSCLRLDVTCHPLPLLLCAVPPPHCPGFVGSLSIVSSSPYLLQEALFALSRTSSERVGVRKFLVHLLERVVLLASPVHRSHFWVSLLPDFRCLLFLGFTSLSSLRVLPFLLLCFVLPPCTIFCPPRWPSRAPSSLLHVPLLAVSFESFVPSSASPTRSTTPLPLPCGPGLEFSLVPCLAIPTALHLAGGYRCPTQMQGEAERLQTAWKNKGET